MSTIAVDYITDNAGSGGPTLTNGLTLGTANLAAPTGNAPGYICRAWVRFGSTGTIAAGGNVTSVTNPATGRYLITFTQAMPDTNYAWSGSANLNSLTVGGIVGESSTTRTTTTLEVYVENDASTAVNPTSTNILVFR